MNQETNIHAQTTITPSWNRAKGSFDYAFGFAFHSKAQYLIFRQLWKQNYLALSKTIHEQKKLIKSTMRKREYAGQHQCQACKCGLEATRQLLMLNAAQKEANRQYLAAKQLAN